MKGILDLFKKFFAVGFQLQTYLNLVYLTLALPLGIIYFVVLSTGFGTGLGTSIILVGVFILLLTLALAWALAALERQLAIWLLRVNIGPMGRQPQAPGFWYWLQAYLGNPITWSGLLFLFLKLPIGVVTFSVTVTLLSLSVALLLAPLAYGWLPLTFFFWRIDTLPQALILFILGLVVTALSLHLLNFLAGGLGRWAQMLLGTAAPAAAAPAPAGRPAGGSCLLPCAAVALFACAALIVCSAASWPLFETRREPSQPAATLTATGAAGTATLTAPALPSATPSPNATATPTPTFTATTAATATDTPTSVPPTATLPTATSTATASATATLAPTFTPTPAGPDPMANAGSVLFNETFAPAKYYWGTGENTFSRLAIAEGALDVTVMQPKHVV